MDTVRNLQYLFKQCIHDVMSGVILKSPQNDIWCFLLHNKYKMPLRIEAQVLSSLTLKILTTVGEGGVLIPFIARLPGSGWERGLELNSFIISLTHRRRLDT